VQGVGLSRLNAVNIKVHGVGQENPSPYKKARIKLSYVFQAFQVAIAKLFRVFEQTGISL
jgi:hypothetical protein